MKVAVDTNVLVRYLTEDDEHESAQAARAIEEADAIVIPTIVLCELVWVLRRAYRYSGAEVEALVQRLITSRQVETDYPAAQAGLRALGRGGDFADGVIHHDMKRAGASHIATFDRAFAAWMPSSEVILLGDPP